VVFLIWGDVYDKREKYLEEIRKVMGKQVIKVLLGMRRVGKSTLLLQIQEELLS